MTVSGRSQSARSSPASAVSAARLAALAVDGALSKKARNVVVVDLRGVTAIADFFVICSGDSDLQIRAIAGEVESRIRDESGDRPWHREGLDHLQWVLLDYVDTVVHVFAPERREHYGLERLWGDAKVELVAEDGSASTVELLKAAGN